MVETAKRSPGRLSLSLVSAYPISAASHLAGLSLFVVQSHLNHRCETGKRRPRRWHSGKGFSNLSTLAEKQEKERKAPPARGGGGNVGGPRRPATVIGLFRGGDFELYLNGKKERTTLDGRDVNEKGNSKEKIAVPSTARILSRSRVVGGVGSPLLCPTRPFGESRGHFF